jgi:Tol biopolymer transport system component/DNA-binding winged helix-turn-helix (wHTH) protein
MSVGYQNGNGSLLRFGVFDVDLRTQELRKYGTRLKLPRQSFQVLQILLERPGELVTREELHKALWSSDTFVDFDHGLNNAVKRIRKALGDSADAPHFIETLPRLGYRFIATVEVANGNNGSSGVVNGNGAVANGNGASLHLNGTVVTSAPSTPQTFGSVPTFAMGTPYRPQALLWIIAVLSVLVISMAVWVYRSRPLPSTDTLQISPFTSYPGYEFSPTFSPDGNQIAFTWTGSDRSELSDLYVKVVGTDTPVQLTHNPATVIIPAWSPDGRFIAFTRFKVDSPEDSGVFVIPSVGGPERKLGTLTFGKYTYQGGLTWTPDGRSVIFPEPYESEFKSQLVVLNVDTLEHRALPSPSSRCTAHGLPRFSPDGKTLAFACMYSFGLGGVFVQAWPNGTPRQILEARGEVDGLTWGPEGRSLVYTLSSNLWRIPVRGGTPERLWFGQNAYNPTVAPTAERLAFTHQEEEMDLHRLPLGNVEDSAEKSVRFVPSELSQKNPQYSPDGKRVAFESNRSGSIEVWVSNVDGTDLQRLTSFGGPLTGTPRWSPDGKRIVFDSRASGKPELYIINADGGTPQMFRTTPDGGSVPFWSHDGRWIYFASDVQRVSQIFKVPAEGGQPVQLTHGGGLLVRELPDGSRLYYLRVSGKTEIWSIGTDGSGEAQVKGLPSFSWPAWDLTTKGIYYYDAIPPSKEILFFDFASRRSHVAARTPGRPAPFVTSLSVSPDGKELVYAELERSSADIMLVDGFR